MNAGSNRMPFIISMTIIGVAALFLLIAGCLAFIPVDVVKTNVQPYKIVTPVVEAGENMIYEADVCKYKEVYSVVTRSFVDEKGVNYPLPQQYSNIPAGCGKNRVIVPTLPTYHSGKWYMTLDVQYQVNPLRTQTYHFRTDTFTINNTTTKLPTQEVQ